MLKSFSKFAVAALLVCGLASMAGAASASVIGNFIFTNNSSAQLDLTWNSYPASYSQRFPPKILARSSASAYANMYSSDSSYFGSTTWTDSKSKQGCQFVTSVYYSSYTGKYSFTFTAVKQGPATGKITCSITASRNVNTGDFTAYPVIGGF
jgi:hypothetical protein